MYWWKIHDLRTELANGTLPERARFQYLLIYTVLSTVAVEFPLLSPEPNLWDRAFTVVAFSLAVLGTTWLYRQNGGGRGHGFLERYLSLGWVFLLRFIVFSAPVFIAAFIGGELAGVVTDETGSFEVFVMTAWTAGYLVGLGGQFRRVVRAEPAA